MTQSSPDAVGNYQLATYPDCAELHHGRYEGQGVFIVGRLTEVERLFRFTQLAEASAYSRETGGVIESVSANALCSDAVYDLYD